MKIIALEYGLPGATLEKFQQYACAEAAQAWKLHQKGFIRELYFRTDRRETVFILESADPESARQNLATLPLVEHGLIAFDLIPLVAYPGFARLFQNLST